MPKKNRTELLVCSCWTTCKHKALRLENGVKNSISILFLSVFLSFINFLLSGSTLVDCAFVLKLLTFSISMRKLLGQIINWHNLIELIFVSLSFSPYGSNAERWIPSNVIWDFMHEIEKTSKKTYAWLCHCSNNELIQSWYKARYLNHRNIHAAEFMPCLGWHSPQNKKRFSMKLLLFDEFWRRNSWLLASKMTKTNCMRNNLVFDFRLKIKIMKILIRILRQHSRMSSPKCTKRFCFCDRSRHIWFDSKLVFIWKWGCLQLVAVSCELWT